MGALIIICSLVFETFAQQPVAVIEPFNIPVLTGLSGGTHRSLNISDPEFEWTAAVSGLSHAALAQLYVTGSTIVTPESATSPCSKPQCVFGPYATLSFCSKCVDVVREAVFKCDSSGRSCNISLSTGATLITDSASLLLSPRDLPQDPPTGQTILADYSVISPISLDGLGGTVSNAFTCTISPCAQVYALSRPSDYSNGSLIGNIDEGNEATGTFVETIYAMVHKSTTFRADMDKGWVVLVIPNGTLLDSFTAGIGSISRQSFPPWHSTNPSFLVDLASVQFLRLFFASVFNASISGTDTFVAESTNCFQKPACDILWTQLSSQSPRNNPGFFSGTIALTANSMGNWL